jgi:hypothetical protein
VKSKQRDSEETILYAVLDVTATCWPTSFWTRFLLGSPSISREG